MALHHSLLPALANPAENLPPATARDLTNTDIQRMQASRDQRVSDYQITNTMKVLLMIASLLTLGQLACGPFPPVPTATPIGTGEWILAENSAYLESEFMEDHPAYPWKLTVTCLPEQGSGPPNIIKMRLTREYSEVLPEAIQSQTMWKVYHNLGEDGPPPAGRGWYQSTDSGGHIRILQPHPVLQIWLVQAVAEETEKLWLAVGKELTVFRTEGFPRVLQTIKKACR